MKCNINNNCNVIDIKWSGIIIFSIEKAYHYISISHLLIVLIRGFNINCNGFIDIGKVGNPFPIYMIVLINAL